jgi:hypothetical protein
MEIRIRLQLLIGKFISLNILIYPIRFLLTKFLKYYRNFNSSFLGRSRASDLLEKFKEALKGLPLQKMVHISMDGPNVNWAFIKLLKTELWQIPGFPQFLETGYCGLHVVHGAFLTGHPKANWKVSAILSAGYYLLHDNPARRAEFSRISGLSFFPAKFCRTRWVENSGVASRFLKLFDGLKKKNTLSSQAGQHWKKASKIFLFNPKYHSSLQLLMSWSLI